MTVIELMIVVVLATQIVGALSMLVGAHRRSSIESERQAQVQEIERQGLASLERDLRSARSVRLAGSALVIEGNDAERRWEISGGGLCRDGQLSRRIRGVRAVDLEQGRLVEVRLIKARGPAIELVVHPRGGRR